jgi:hypothetical protein
MMLAMDLCINFRAGIHDDMNAQMMLPDVTQRRIDHGKMKGTGNCVKRMRC